MKERQSGVLMHISSLPGNTESAHLEKVLTILWISW